MKNFITGLEDLDEGVYRRPIVQTSGGMVQNV